MSVELIASIICDSCGDRINGDIHDRTSNGYRSYWDAKTKAKAAHWLFQQRFGSTIHLCQKCADSGKQIPRMPVARTLHYRYLVQQDDGRMLCMGSRIFEPGHNFTKDAGNCQNGLVEKRKAMSRMVSRASFIISPGIGLVSPPRRLLQNTRPHTKSESRDSTMP